MVLPRQARNEHEKNADKKRRFAQEVLTTATAPGLPRGSESESESDVPLGKVLQVAMAQDESTLVLLTKSAMFLLGRTGQPAGGWIPNPMPFLRADVNNHEDFASRPSDAIANAAGAGVGVGAGSGPWTKSALGSSSSSSSSSGGSGFGRFGAAAAAGGGGFGAAGSGFGGGFGRLGAASGGGFGAASGGGFGGGRLGGDGGGGGGDGGPFGQPRAAWDPVWQQQQRVGVQQRPGPAGLGAVFGPGGGFGPGEAAPRDAADPSFGRYVQARKRVF